MHNWHDIFVDCIMYTSIKPEHQRFFVGARSSLVKPVKKSSSMRLVHRDIASVVPKFYLWLARQVGHKMVNVLGRIQFSTSVRPFPVPQTRNKLQKFQSSESQSKDDNLWHEIEHIGSQDKYKLVREVARYDMNYVWRKKNTYHVSIYSHWGKY